MFIEQKLRKMSWVQRKIEFQATKYESSKENHEPARLINDRPPVMNDRAPFNIPTIRSRRLVPHPGLRVASRDGSHFQTWSPFGVTAL